MDFHEEWPDTLDNFEVFPKRVPKPEFEDVKVCELVNCVDCVCPVTNSKPLIEHLYANYMCPRHIPRELVITPGKLLIHEGDTRVVEFLKNKDHSLALDFIANLEKLAHISPSRFDHLLVIHKLFFNKTPGHYKDSILLNSKMEFHRHPHGIETLILAFDLGDMTMLRDQWSKHLDDAWYLIQSSLQRLHNPLRPIEYFRARSHSI